MKHIQVLTSRQKVPVLTYQADEEIKKGDIISVPFRNQQIMGVVWEGKADTKEDKEFNIKPIYHKFDLPAINANFIKFLESFAKYYILDLASCCKMVIPIDLKPDKIYKSKSIEPKIALPELNILQTKAYNEINSTEKVSLLEGVTGSGKTEVYFHIIADYLKNGKQILLMLPEIGLTSQLLERFSSTFGFKPSIWHSGITPAKKKEIYWNIVKGDEKVLIGTRSSLFLPYKDLGLIIIDEEHDGAYKQEENILYNARDAAILRASFENIKTILVSATPSLETYLNSQKNKYQHSILTSRYGVAKMPNVKIIDMKGEVKGKWISKPLGDAIKQGLKNGLQSLLFLNRRGYAPLMLCGGCGFRLACDSCSSWLVVHKKKQALICHHCGYTKTIPKICPECSSENIISCGPGVERILEEAQELFPSAKIHLFTKEETSSRDLQSELVKQIENSEIDIIIGTQIITKGYHFPKVSTVGIIDADLGAANIDLKANERCFQILQQVSGRAGRDEYEGSVYIQTYFPDNKMFEILSHNLTSEFYENELQNREQNFLPPYARIIAVIITGEDEISTLNFAKKVKSLAPNTERVKLLGPAPATMSKLKGTYRFRILLIADKAFNLQSYVKYWIKNCDSKARETIRIEVDPYSFY